MSNLKFSVHIKIKNKSKTLNLGLANIFGAILKMLVKM